MPYQFSRLSQKRLDTCHYDLRLIMSTAIHLSDVDFGIADGYRSPERQNKYFRAGKSKIDGYNRKGKHNQNPSHAVDIYAYYDNRAQWDREHLTYIAGVVMTVANMLYESGKIFHLVRWGGNWDNDGILLRDQSFDDLPHFELYKPE